MSLSEYYEDESVVNSLRSFFGLDEQWTIDFQSLLSQVEDYDDENYSLKIKDKTFLIHKIHGGVTEVET
jgi:hypothetical protein